MKQLVQYASEGKVRLLDVPKPVPKPRQILVRTLASAVSTGTERGNLAFARASLAAKARRRPDLVQKVVTKSLQEGPAAAYRQASSRLNEAFPLGYSSCGVVETVGEGVESFAPGQLVACSGARFATHAEFVAVPETMCTAVPDGVSAEDAAFSALAAVVIHAIRRGGVEVGSRVAFVGLGLLGLLGIQIAKASGATVIGADISEKRCSLGSSLGADLCVVPDRESAEAVRGFCGAPSGADVVIVTATSTTNEPFVWAAEIARERGHIVVVGNFPPDLPRRYGYDKELTIEFSRAWGPGTYDPEFQQRGHGEGYPISLVRWTAPLNMRTYLELVASGSVRLRPLITHRYPIERAPEAYEVLDDPRQAPLGVLITYPEASPEPETKSNAGQPSKEFLLVDEKASTTPGSVSAGPPLRRRSARTRPGVGGSIRLGIIGAGNHVTSALMPAFRAIQGIEVRAICAPSGVRAADVAARYGIPQALSDVEELIDDDGLDAVVIATRHDTHAGLAVEALRAGKHVWVEKPLALRLEDVDTVEMAASDSGRMVIVGFNRRFSPLTEAAVDHVRRGRSGPFYVSIRANPGSLETGHWVLDEAEGGGRLLSEGCHFFDLACALTGAMPTAVAVSASSPDQDGARLGFAASIEFDDGSLASITYAGAGPSSFGRERFEIIGPDRAAAVEEFRRLYRSGRFGRVLRTRLTSQKGVAEMAGFFVEAALGRRPFEETMQQMLVSSRLTLYAEQSRRTGQRVRVDGRADLSRR